jgi:hypothetical protein
MKGIKMKLLLFLLIPFVMFSQVKMIETQYDDGLEYYIYAVSVDSGSYNQEFVLTGFDNDLYNYPLSYALKIDTLTNDAQTEIIGVYIQAYQIDQWINIDTLSAADTLNSSHSLASATFYGKGALNLNAYSYGAFPRYRLNVVATHSADTDLFAFYVKLYATKRD